MSEANCDFICSRGILKSCTFHSPNPRSSCNNDFNYLGNMIRDEKMYDKMSIYVCSDYQKFVIYLHLYREILICKFLKKL